MASFFAPALLIAAVGVLCLTDANAESRTDNRALIRNAFEAWAAGTGSPFDLLADNAEWTIVGNSEAAGIYSGREAFMRDVIEPFNARMQVPLRPKLRELYADGDTVIAFFDAAGTARDGQAYTNTYAWFMKMRDGRIVEVHAFFDSIAFNDLWQRVQPAP